MSDAFEPAEKPRTWLPVIGAIGAGVLVLAIALSTVIFGDQLSDTQKATIEACEAEYLGSDRVPIYGGHVYVPPELREYYAVAETHGEVPEPLEDVPDTVLAEWEAAGERWVDTGSGPVVLVWRHEDETYTQCNVEFVAGEIVAGSVQLGPLVAPRHG